MRRSRLALTCPASWMAPPNKQQLLGQRGLAGVRMRDDREGAPPLDLGRQRRGSRRDLRGADGLIHCRLDVAVPAFVIKAFGGSVPGRGGAISR